MTDSPFRPPTKLGPATSGVPVQRPGMVPVPPEREQQRRRGAIPTTAPVLPGRPRDVTVQDGETVAPLDRWAYHHRDKAGPREDEEAAFSPAIELEEIRPLVVLFYENTQTNQPPGPLDSSNFSYYVFDGTSTGDGGLGPGKFRTNEVDENQPVSTLIYVALPPSDGNLKSFLDSHIERTLSLQWGSSYADFTVDAYEVQHDDGTDIDYLVLTTTPTDSLINETDGPLDDGEACTLVAGGLRVPNARARARVRYRAGKSDVQFDCDWSGGFLVHADRLELSRVTFAPDVTLSYYDAPIEIAATVLADAPPPAAGLALTVAPMPVDAEGGMRELPVPAIARRVNLLLKYGNDPDVPGDAPLGQLFLAWVGKYDRSLCFIDAMSAREALFGVGLPVPFGVSKLVLSNRSDDDTVEMGVLWQLAL